MASRKLFRFLREGPPAPGKNMQAMHSTANLSVLFAVGGVYFIYTGNSYNIQDLFTMLDNLTHFLPNFYGFKYGVVHVDKIPIYEVRQFQFNDLTYIITQLYSGLDILGNIGNRGFNYHGLGLHLPIYGLMPIIGYIVHNFLNLDFKNILFNVFKSFNDLFSKKFLFNKLKNYLPSVSDIRVFMFSSTATGHTFNQGNKESDEDKNRKNKPNNPDLNKKELIHKAKNKRIQLLRRFGELLFDLESYVATLDNLLRNSNVTFNIATDGSSYAEVPEEMSRDHRNVTVERLDNLDISIRTRHLSIEQLITELGQVETILSENDASFGDTTSDMKTRTLQAMNHFYSITNEDTNEEQI